VKSAFGPAAACVALVIGIAIGESGSVEPYVAYAIGFASLGASLLSATRATMIVVLVGALALGIAGGSRTARAGVVPGGWVWPAGFAMVEGTVVDEASGNRYQSSVVVDVRSVDGGKFGRRARLEAGGRDALRFRLLRRGDFVVARVRLRSAGRDMWATRDGAIAIGDDAELLSFEPSTEPHVRVGTAVRDRIELGVRLLPERDRGLVLGFLLGDTSAIEAADRDAFRRSGLSHLLAVSGANVAFVLALVAPLLRRVGYRSRFAIGLGVVLMFAAATRFEPSVLRAGAMAAVVMLAQVSGRDVHPARALSLAVGVLLVIDPRLVQSVGFRLSVVATAGIVVAAEPIARRVRGPAGLRSAIGVTASAQAAVAPLLVVEFGSVPLVALATNLAAAPAAAPLTMHGFVASVLAPSLPSPLARLVLAPCSWLVTWIRAVAHVGARVPLEIDGRGLVVMLVVAAVWAAVPRGFRG
jgi:ComEC/Rec2-related protein